MLRLIQGWKAMPLELKMLCVGTLGVAAFGLFFAAFAIKDLLG